MPLAISPTFFGLGVEAGAHDEWLGADDLKEMGLQVLLPRLGHRRYPAIRRGRILQRQPHTLTTIRQRPRLQDVYLGAWSELAHFARLEIEISSHEQRLRWRDFTHVCSPARRERVAAVPAPRLSPPVGRSASRTRLAACAFVVAAAVSGAAARAHVAAASAAARPLGVD